MRTTTLLTRALGRTGLQVTALGFGSAPVGFLGDNKDGEGKLLNDVLDAGINLIDTAASYADAENLIGNYIAHRRKEYVLVSKCGQKIPEAPDAQPWSAAVVTATVDRALKRLRTDALDVMLLHSCDLATLQKGEALGALVKARQAGKVKFVGYSGDNEAAAWAAQQAEIAVIETSVNIVDQANIESVLPLCVTAQAGVLAKRPIANGAWRDTSEQRSFYKDYTKAYYDRFARMNLSLADLGFAPDAWHEVALRFTLSQPGVTSAIIGTTSSKNLLRNVEAARKGPLTDDVIGKIRAAFKRADPQGTWTGQT
jgi:aryl-alcohol dehydrogenase-like predicted oxidoreductase